MPRTDYHLVICNLKEEILDGTGDSESRMEEAMLQQNLEGCK